MKKILVSMFVLLVFSGFMGSVYAQTVQTTKVQAPRYEIVTAKVLSIDAEKNTFVGKVIQTQLERTFSAAVKIIAKLKVNEEVKLYVTPGTDVVVKMRVLEKHLRPVKTN